jgi:hypothetical protein
MTEKYSYRPLSSARITRVLLLQPDASRNAELRCSLEETSLDVIGDGRRQFHALSYVWGAKTGTQPLFCDGKTILITPNCDSALRHLRHPKKPFVLWVDAVCINQEDLAERTQQVPLMGDIYQRAIKVIIWLGEGTDKTALCFSRMWIISRIFISDWNKLKTLSRLLRRKLISFLSI